MKRLVTVILITAGMLILSTDSLADSSKNNKLSEGVMALRGYMWHVNKSYADRLVKETMEVVSKPENSWMPPHILLGLAINESDLRWWLVTGSYSWPDCGVCQNHTPLFKKSITARWALCKLLKKSTKLSLEHAMFELNDIKNKWCDRYYPEPVYAFMGNPIKYKSKYDKWRIKYYRCILNIYNQGPRYLTRPCHKRYNKKKYTPKQYKDLLGRCRWRALYWARSMCFSRGLLLRRKPTIPCRRALGMGWIDKVYGAGKE